jgi:hypothetical protein
MAAHHPVGWPGDWRGLGPKIPLARCAQLDHILRRNDIIPYLLMFISIVPKKKPARISI